MPGGHVNTRTPTDRIYYIVRYRILKLLFGLVFRLLKDVFVLVIIFIIIVIRSLYDFQCKNMNLRYLLKV